MQAIVTKFIGPTNKRSARVSARCDAGRVTVDCYDAATRGVDAHDLAARELARKLGWTSDVYGDLVGGGLPGGKGNCYVFVPRKRGR